MKNIFVSLPVAMFLCSCDHVKIDRQEERLIEDVIEELIHEMSSDDPQSNVEPSP